MEDGTVAVAVALAIALVLVPVGAAAGTPAASGAAGPKAAPASDAPGPGGAGPSGGAGASGDAAAAQGTQNRTAPPGVTNGTLVNETALLDAHTALLMATGFAANGTGEVTVVKRGVLVDGNRSENRTVAANGTAYRSSATDVGETPFGTVTRNEDVWGNETLEVERTVERGRTSYVARPAKKDRRLTGARRLSRYLRAGEFVVNGTRTVGGERRYVLVASGLENRSALAATVPRAGANPRNYTATLVVDGAGRVHSFRGSVDYTIQGRQRTHRISFTLLSVGVDRVARPPWVDTALARTEAPPTTAGGNGTTTGV